MSSEFSVDEFSLSIRDLESTLHDPSKQHDQTVVNSKITACAVLALSNRESPLIRNSPELKDRALKIIEKLDQETALPDLKKIIAEEDVLSIFQNQELIANALVPSFALSSAHPEP